MSRRLILGAFIQGAPSLRWRTPGADLQLAQRFEPYRAIAERLEHACFDLLFMNDLLSIGSAKLDSSALAKLPGTVRWDPLILLSALAVVTRDIGLVATANTTYNEPYTLARHFAALDCLSNGRAGWNLVTSLDGGENYNRDNHVDHHDRYERAEEFFDVVAGLWNSWDEDAFPRDRVSGQWLDTSRMHVLNHRGRHFSVKGPLNAPRPPQGKPLITQAGASPAGCRLGARTADIVFTAAQSMDAARQLRSELRTMAQTFGRGADALKVMPGVAVYVGATLAEAQANFDRIHAGVDPASALMSLSDFASLGTDLSRLPLDAPVPLPAQPPVTQTHRSRQALVYELIRSTRPTVRELFRQLSAGGHRVLIGTPQSIADDFETWFEQGAADGFNLMFSHLPGAVDDFVEQVIPELQRRGLHQSSYRTGTLREKLSLPSQTAR
ncbi:LLM class flavin-dependent oxidoreductase [Pseudomonas sp. D5002]|uniref:LLM class flavin-dependent oxidoreductase n=1 Tax=Pseudomonas sp. D5002 TaxID=2738818 RepID=UPI0015A45C03|nr:LLM class flavin-dependent oxidoreductase [Pseudomonas sp. D5002]NWB09096.1 LLM class flavin-dependent oxidoreductase [Pseudomonas sp. D5002]